MSSTSNHTDRILDQFTRQAVVFQQTHRDAREALDLLVTRCAPRADDDVLDVACGPGVVSCALAPRVRHVTGIDITPAMLTEAARLQRASGLQNLAWIRGDVNRMPFPDASFSLVVSRYAMHHCEDPRTVIAEMARVCAPGGRVVVADSAPLPARAAAFNAAERMRDPSHTRALTAEELTGAMVEAGLRIGVSQLYAWEVPADGLLARSFPNPGDAQRLLQAYAEDVAVDRLGMHARTVDGVLHVTFPTLILVGHR